MPKVLQNFVLVRLTLFLGQGTGNDQLAGRPKYAEHFEADGRLGRVQSMLGPSLGRGSWIASLGLSLEKQ